MVEKTCSCCGDYPLADGETYFCELCAAIHHGESGELAIIYRDKLERYKERIREALGYIETLHYRNCAIHTAGELAVDPCDCDRRTVIELLETCCYE